MIAERWNHDIAYHGLVLRAVPVGARRALDVGSGDGALARALAAVVPEVWALDPDAPTLARAAAEDRGQGVRYIHGDLCTTPLPDAAFDLVAAVASLHHMDERAALGRMASLLRPGGRLVVIGVGRADLPHDLPYEVVGAVLNRLYQATRGFWRSGAPTRPPTRSYADMRRLAEAALPDVRYRRHVLFRYSLLWTRPAEVPAGRGGGR